MTQIVFASTNQGKIREIQQLLDKHAVEVVPQATMNVKEIPEEGLTFIENALMKARHATAVTKLPALADDSGLVVPALRGAPGIFSARYAGEHATSQECIEKLLANMQEVVEEKRQAFYYCSLIFMQHAMDPCPIVCEGIWPGMILFKPQGNKGFGYDPIFYDLNYQCSAAQLPPDIKNRISHRGQAVTKLLKKFDYRALIQR
jgi:XTP/dITP diphosphohydrolase